MRRCCPIANPPPNGDPLSGTAHLPPVDAFVGCELRPPGQHRRRVRRMVQERRKSATRIPGTAEFQPSRVFARRNEHAEETGHARLDGTQPNGGVGVTAWPTPRASRSQRTDGATSRSDTLPTPRRRPGSRATAWCGPCPVPPAGRFPDRAALPPPSPNPGWRPAATPRSGPG